MWVILILCYCTIWKLILNQAWDVQYIMISTLLTFRQLDFKMTMTLNKMIAAVICTYNICLDYFSTTEQTNPSHSSYVLNLQNQSIETNLLFENQQKYAPLRPGLRHYLLFPRHFSLCFISHDRFLQFFIMCPNLPQY